jgi:hypothetical protein
MNKPIQIYNQIYTFTMIICNFFKFASVQLKIAQRANDIFIWILGVGIMVHFAGLKHLIKHFASLNFDLK